MENEKNKPNKKYTRAGIQVAEWLNTVKTKDGNEIPLTNYSIQRSYTDKDGNWKNTTTMRLQDLEYLQQIIRKILQDQVKEKIE